MGSQDLGNDDDAQKIVQERDSSMATTITNSNMGDVTVKPSKPQRQPLDSTIVPYDKSKKGAFSRLSGRWKGKKGSGGGSIGNSRRTFFVLMPDLNDNDPIQETPPKTKGNVTLKKCKKLSRKKEYKVKLHEGILKLFPKGNTAAALEPEFKIDLSQVTVSYDDNIHRLKLVFKVEAHQFIPETVDDYHMWKDMMSRHRMYRQDLVRRGLNCSESSIRPRVPTLEPAQTVLKKPSLPIEATTMPLIIPPPTQSPPVTTRVSDDKKYAQKLDDTRPCFSVLSQMMDTQPHKNSVDLLVRALEECTALHHQSAELLAEMVKATSNTRLLFAEIQSVWLEMKVTRPIKDEESDGIDDDDSDDEDEESLNASNANVLVDADEVKKKNKDVITSNNADFGTLAPITPLNMPMSTPVMAPISTPTLIPSQKPDKVDNIDNNFEKKEDEKIVGKLEPPPLKKNEVKPLPPSQSTFPTLTPLPLEKKTDEDNTTSISLLPLESTPQVVTKPQLQSKPKEMPPPPPVIAPPLPPPRVKRAVLPSPQLPGEALGLSTLAAAVMQGLPITTFEPLGLLQVICEELRFVPQTLSKAVNCTDSVERMCYIAAFAISGYSCMGGRNRKPFNPVMGETFDFISENGWKFHGEQVGHHPPCSAVTASGRGFEWWQTVQSVHKTTWSGSIELMPEYPVRLRLGGDEYLWNKVKTIILNAASNPENRVIQNKGIMMIKCSNGVECKLIFKGDKNGISGEIKDKRSGATCKLIGRWDRGLNRQLPGEDQESIFEVPPAYPYSRIYYGFSKFSMGLNELFPEDKDKLPYTDSRFRPDMRHLEYGDASKALAAKYQLEGEQRARVKSGQTAKPIWFEFRTDEWSSKKMWLSNERYWKMKEQKFQDEYSQTACHVFGSQELRQ